MAIGAQAIIFDAYGTLIDTKDGFLRVLSGIGLRADQVVYVGDSLRDDVFGPRQVGIRSVWINRKNRPLGNADPVPDYQIRDLRELLPLLGMTGPK